MDLLSPKGGFNQGGATNGGHLPDNKDQKRKKILKWPIRSLGFWSRAGSRVRRTAGTLELRTGPCREIGGGEPQKGRRSVYVWVRPFRPKQPIKPPSGQSPERGVDQKRTPGGSVENHRELGVFE